MLKCPHVPRRGRQRWTYAVHPALSGHLPRGTGAHPGLLAALEGWLGGIAVNTGGKGNRCSPTASGDAGVAPASSNEGSSPCTLLGLELRSLKIMAAAASWQRGQDPQLLQLCFYALKFSATHLKKAAVANNRARARESKQHKSPG